jgi:hypothetical protein
VGELIESETRIQFVANVVSACSGYGTRPPLEAQLCRRARIVSLRLAALIRGGASWPRRSSREGQLISLKTAPSGSPYRLSGFDSAEHAQLEQLLHGEPWEVASRFTPPLGRRQPEINADFAVAPSRVLGLGRVLGLARPVHLGEGEICRRRRVDRDICQTGLARHPPLKHTSVVREDQPAQPVCAGSSGLLLPGLGGVPKFSQLEARAARCEWIGGKG